MARQTGALESLRSALFWLAFGAFLCTLAQEDDLVKSSRYYLELRSYGYSYLGRPRSFPARVCNTPFPGTQQERQRLIASTRNRTRHKIRMEAKDDLRSCPGVPGKRAACLLTTCCSRKVLVL